jgi:hypothetical protein
VERIIYSIFQLFILEWTNRTLKLFTSRVARERKIENTVARSVVRERSIGEN